jgi:hypothetical protein
MKAPWLAYLVAGVFGLNTISFTQQKPCPGGKPCGSFPAGGTGTCNVDVVPPGSYQQTCRNMVSDCRKQPTITGSCKTSDGAWKPATLSAINTCTDIENCNVIFDAIGEVSRLRDRIVNPVAVYTFKPVRLLRIVAARMVLGQARMGLVRSLRISLRAKTGSRILKAHCTANLSSEI